MERDLLSWATAMLATSLRLAFVTFALVACGSDQGAASVTSDVESSSCPAAGEQAEDCPWAAVARDLRAESSREAIQARLHKELPELDAAITQVSTIGGNDLRYADLWGRSSNYDASQINQPSPKPTIDEPILDAINDRAGLGDARHGDLGPIHDAITFAGVEHTYGYLFSLLSTPFGFKRARWVRDDVEAGFGLTRGTLGPLPGQGTLFANVTYFAGRIAFRDEASSRERAALEDGGTSVSPELVSFPYDRLAPARVVETVVLEGERTIVITTDFVAFDTRTSAPDGNAQLLIYAVRDSAEGRTRLISAFPVSNDSRAQALAASRMGDAQTITTQYNAYVEGLTNAPAPVQGSRHVL
jgi:hypothetical protein